MKERSGQLVKKVTGNCLTNEDFSLQACNYVLMVDAGSDVSEVVVSMVTEAGVALIPIDEKAGVEVCRKA